MNRFVGRLPFVKYFANASWAQPFIIFAAIDLVGWQLIALFGLETAATVSMGSTLLVALLAILWRDEILTHATFVYAWIALVSALTSSGITGANQFAITGGAGLGLYLVGRVIARIKFARVTLWLTALRNAALAYTGLAVVLTLSAFRANAFASAASFAFAGLLYLALAYQLRRLRVGYLGVALLEGAWVLVMLNQNNFDPQWYALPVGVYLVGVGFLERRMARAANAKQFAQLIEGLGLAVLLLTSFVQSLSGAAGLPYFLLLMGEALAVIAYSAFLHLRVPFFGGLGASVLNVLAQIVVLVGVYDINRWLVIFGVGILLVLVAVLVERKRAQIIAKAQEWLAILETWE